MDEFEFNSDLPNSLTQIEAEKWLWSWDRMHFPNAMTPMSASIEGPAFEQGFNSVADFFAKPYLGVEVRFFRYYWYQRIIPYEGNPDTRRQQHLKILSERKPRARQIFEEQLLPEVQAINRALCEFDYASDASDLFAFLGEIRRMRTRVWEIHFLALHPATTAANEFLDLYQHILGPATSDIPLQMLQGFPNKTVESLHRLWLLSQEIRKDAQLYIALLPLQPEKWWSTCEQTVSGKHFLASLNAFLTEFGLTINTWDFYEKPWIEDPTPVFRTLRGMLQQGTPDPSEVQYATAQQREQLVATTLTRLSGHPQEFIFRQTLLAAQQCLPLMENHYYYIDQVNTALMRLPLVTLGNRLANDGIVDMQNDIFFLTADEVLDLAVQRPDKGLRQRIWKRRRDWQSWRHMTPPESIGSTDQAADTDLHTRRFFGPATRSSEKSSLLQGRAASQGVATGRVRVAHELAELDKFEAGEILVCPAVTPAWTYVLPKAAALITDTGGELSHGAIVAREYRIPCVVGTLQATDLLQSGQVVTVDGSSGTVRIHS
jgi:pyruvate,water dikinase